MAMVNVVSTLAASLGRSVAEVIWLGPEVGGRLALVLHSSNELGELSQWQCDDVGTISTVAYCYYYCYYCH